VTAAIGAARTGGMLMSVGLFALWVGWPGGLALYACGRAARVMGPGVWGDGTPAAPHHLTMTLNKLFSPS
jgi:hypothetical protein